MYQIDLEKNEIVKLPPKRFGDMGLTERGHLQEWLAGCPSCLGEELLVIQKEFDGFNETRERLDLLALDKEGTLVVIENKLDDSGRDVVWQALKYASYCSSLSKSQIVEIYQTYLDRHETGASAEKKLREFYDDRDFSELILNHGVDQRLILVAAHFRKEVTSTVLWLREHGIRLQCVKATAFGHGAEVFLNLERIIPVPEAEDFIIRVSEKEKEQKNAENSQEKRQSVRLEFWGVVLNTLEQAGVGLYKNVSPGRDHWLHAGSGLGGVPYTMIFLQTEIRVNIWITWGTGSENKWIFDRLYSQKDEIEKDFGAELVWRRLDDKRASEIRFVKECDGFDREGWEDLALWFVEHMKRLEVAFGHRLKALAPQLKAGVAQGNDLGNEEA